MNLQVTATMTAVLFLSNLAFAAAKPKSCKEVVENYAQRILEDEARELQAESEGYTFDGISDVYSPDDTGEENVWEVSYGINESCMSGLKIKVKPTQGGKSCKPVNYEYGTTEC